jgi:hypothetical protein
VNALRVYRDDGPLARAVGARPGTIRLPAAALVAAGVLGLAAAIVLGGAQASTALATAAIAWLVALGALSAAAPENGAADWLVPPLLRAGEYAAVIWLAARTGHAHLAGAFALLAAVAYRHYDLAYRLRIRGALSPAWLDAASGGWDGRLVVVWVLGVAGALPEALYVLAAGLGAMLIIESVRSWTRAGRAPGGVIYDDEGDEGQ